VTEAELLEAVVELAHLRGWRVAHFRPARTEKGWRTAVSADGKGFPDLVLARTGEILFVELKSAKGRVSREQQEWLVRLDIGRSTFAGVWRPVDWTAGVIDGALR
jgi:hypothetical protein